MGNLIPAHALLIIWRIAHIFRGATHFEQEFPTSRHQSPSVPFILFTDYLELPHQALPLRFMINSHTCYSLHHKGKLKEGKEELRISRPPLSTRSYCLQVLLPNFHWSPISYSLSLFKIKQFHTFQQVQSDFILLSCTPGTHFIPFKGANHSSQCAPLNKGLQPFVKFFHFCFIFYNNYNKNFLFLQIFSYSPHIEFVRTRPTLREGYHMAFGIKWKQRESNPLEVEAGKFTVYPVSLTVYTSKIIKPIGSLPCALGK